MHSVIPTIISRCNTVWSPGNGQDSIHTEGEESLHSDVIKFLDSYTEGKHAEAIGVLLGHSKAWPKFLDVLVSVMAREVSILSSDPSEEKAKKVLSLWERTRPLLSPSAARSGVSLAVSQLFGHTLL